MLFDLRGRGRRNTVRVIYIGLALLIGLGLVGFGIGGGFGGGGILSAASENNGGGGSSSFASQIAKYKKLTKQQPTNVAAWEGLTKALLHEVGGTTQTGITTRSRELMQEASGAWGSYLALRPPRPSPELAQLMVTVYGEEALNKPSQAEQALQIVVASRPTSAALYSLLAEYAYKAHDVRTGDLAAERAVSLAPAADQARVKKELAEVKAKPSGPSAGETYTTVTNGKTYAVKKAPNGQFTGTVIKSTPPPATGSSTTSTQKK
jgi:hypothetical protein